MKMKSNKRRTALILLIITLLLLSSCGKEQTSCGKEQTGKLANEQSFSLEGIEELTISYDDENVSFFTSENENLIIREYMSRDKKNYYAKVSQNQNSIQISEGGKPVSKSGFTRYVEVYLPDSYSENLKVSTTSGNIDMSDVELNLNTVCVDCTSGILKLKKVVAEDIYFTSTSGTLELDSLTGGQIRIETTQGEVRCGNADGVMTYTSTSGNAEFLSVKGFGSYEAGNSGKLSVDYEEVTGDLFFFNKNDDIQIGLPRELSFELEASTKNGSVNADFQEEISQNGDVVYAAVGDNPKVTVRVETGNGNIDISRK